MTDVTRSILTLNVGSSSLKFALYDAASLEVLLKGAIEGIDLTPKLSLKGRRADEISAGLALPGLTDHVGLTQWLLSELEKRLTDVRIVAAGHRVVHGGQRYSAPVAVTADVLAYLDGLVSLAPGHEPYNLAAIRAVAEIWPGLPQIASFDTEFHRTQPRLEQLFAIPRELTEQGVIRYGFHGLSYEYIASALPGLAGETAQGRVIVAHLGNGASLCAMMGLKSVATTMSFTALDGLVMGTRCGAIDPGVVLHLIHERGIAPDAVSELLYTKSGLLGVSGISGDVRTLEASSDPNAAEALDLFAYRAVREIGALVAVLGGLDILVFTAGIGEHSALVRQRIAAGLQVFGIALEPAANAKNALKISAPGSRVEVLVVPTDEELVIARATQRLSA